MTFAAQPSGENDKRHLIRFNRLIDRVAVRRHFGDPAAIFVTIMLEHIFKRLAHGFQARLPAHRIGESEGVCLPRLHPQAARQVAHRLAVQVERFNSAAQIRVNAFFSPEREHAVKQPIACPAAHETFIRLGFRAMKSRTISAGLIELLVYGLDRLRRVARANQQSIRRVDHDQIVYSRKRNVTVAA